MARRLWKSYGIQDWTDGTPRLVEILEAACQDGVGDNLTEFVLGESSYVFDPYINFMQNDEQVCDTFIADPNSVHQEICL